MVVYTPFVGGESATFLALNRNKKSVALDIQGKAGTDVLLRLAQDADVFLEDLGPGVAERMGFGYERFDRQRPGLVYCAISPFGEQGPLREASGSELVVQAMAEYSRSLGAPGEPPERLGADAANINTGTFAFDVVLAALFHRRRTGEGQRVAVSMLGTLLHMRGIMWSAQSDPDEWYGFHCDSYTNPRDHGYQTKDGAVYFNLRRTNEVTWVSVLSELGMTHVLEDPRFDGGGREAVGTGRYAPEVKPFWEEAFRERSAAEIIELMRRNTAEIAPLNDYEGLFGDPQVEALDVVREMEHPQAGTFKTLAPPWKFDGMAADLGAPPPLLGQHTREVLRESGFTEADIRRLREENAIVIAD